MWALTISISSAAEVILSSLWCVPLFNQCNMFMKLKRDKALLLSLLHKPKFDVH
jgi:hypothetical protein